MKRFILQGTLFLFLLACLLAGLEAYLSRQIRVSHHLLGADVQETLSAASASHRNATSLFIGDSVARQLFHPLREPSAEVVYLTSNQAISMAGQYELLLRGLSRSPRVSQVYLFYTPRSWEDDLDQIFTHDYFCGFFHRPGLIWEVWTLKHDLNLLGAHVARMLMPSIMAQNSWINRGQSIRGVPMQVAATGPRKQVSDVSRHYLNKMRELCVARRIMLHVLPCPCWGTVEQYKDAALVYDVPIRFYDRSLFLPDSIHVIPEHRDDVRATVVSRFHLPAAASMSPSTSPISGVTIDR